MNDIFNYILFIAEEENPNSSRCENLETARQNYYKIFKEAEEK